jgi:hypothetical protein
VEQFLNKINYMKQIKFNNKDYQVPEYWHEVTVGMLIKASELSELLDEAPIIAIISAYTGIPVTQLKVSKTNEVSEIINIMHFITTPYEPKPNTTFLLNRESYHCEDELVDQKFEDFVSIQTALYNHREEPVRALPKLLAILCKKDNEVLDDFDLNERAKLMEQLPMTYAKDVEAFFLHSLNAYRSLTLLSSTQELQKEIVLAKVRELQSTMKQHRVRSGTSFGTKLRIGYYQIVLWWVKSELVRYFNSESTKPLKKNWKQTCKNWLSKKLKRKDDVK